MTSATSGWPPSTPPSSSPKAGRHYGQGCQAQPLARVQGEAQSSACSAGPPALGLTQPWATTACAHPGQGQDTQVGPEITNDQAQI